MRATVKTVIEADSTLMATLTGGVHDGREISRQNTPSAFDANNELLPCALVAIDNEAPAGPAEIGGNMVLSIYFYQYSGYGSIDTAIARAYTVLHGHRVGGGAYTLRWAGDVRDQEDAALNASLAISRYQIARIR